MKEIINHYKIILNCEKFVITGSYAMNMIGIYEKEAADLDILLLNPTKETLELLTKLMKESPAETTPYQSNMFIFKHENKKVDVFITTNAKDVETDLMVNGTYISKCNSVIKAKKSYNRIKDWIQLRKMAQMFFKQSEFENFLDGKNIDTSKIPNWL